VHSYLTVIVFDTMFLSVIVYDTWHISFSRSFLTTWCYASKMIIRQFYNFVCPIFQFPSLWQPRAPNLGFFLPICMQYEDCLEPVHLHSASIFFLHAFLRWFLSNLINYITQGLHCVNQNCNIWLRSVISEIWRWFGQTNCVLFRDRMYVKKPK
jgi:hypothetical protein